MNPSTPAPLWIPEDDFLLKNALEAGASLESLAKGAVRFSRTYSVTQLRDRWLSLLYDPEGAAKGSASMLNLEVSRISGAGTKEASHAGDSGSGAKRNGKRKVKSLRKQYYARQKMRKIIRREVLDSLDIGLDDGVRILEDAVGYDREEIEGNLNKDMNHLLVNSFVGYRNRSGLDEAGAGPSNSTSEVPLWKAMEDVSAPALPVQVSANGVLDAPGGAVAVSGVEDAGISDSPLDLSSGDRLMLDETMTEKPGHDNVASDNVDSLLLSSPCDVIQGNDAPVVPESQKLDTETKLVVPRGSSAAELEVVTNPLGESHDDMHLVSDPGNGVQSSAAAAQSLHRERSDDLPPCLLNSEDTDIPSDDSVNASVVASRLVALQSRPVANDCVNVSVVVPHSVVANDCVNVSVVVPSLALKSQSIAKEVGYSDSSINNQRKNEPGGSLKKEEIPAHSFAAPQTVRSGLVANINSSSTPVGAVLKTESRTRNSISAVSRQNNNATVSSKPSSGRLGQAMPTSDGHAKQKGIGARASAAEVYAHPNAEDHMASKKSEEKSLSRGQEGGGDDDDDDDDNDNDADDNDEDEIPYYSDAEKMILEMDLCPADQDINASREVLGYQHEETKRAIMRLEQCSQSFMQRAIAARGALAVLYGRKMKQYIKKSEVILGRATDGMPVDIDLGREGRANKISRRQAVIKMDANGSFIIKNLGKISIFLNGKEVAHGQLRCLSDGCLIQVSGLTFIFEFSEKCVRRFLENVAPKREG